MANINVPLRYVSGADTYTVVDPRASVGAGGVAYFGAPSGGDDTAALLAAIAAAIADGKVLLLQSGATYQVNGLALPSYTHIDGNWATLRNPDGASTAVLINDDTVGGNERIVLRNLTIDGNAANGTGSGYNVVTFDNIETCTFTDLRVIGGLFVATAGLGCGLSLSQMHRSFLDRIWVEDNGYDGIITGGATWNTFGQLNGRNNGRGTLQFTRYPIGSGTDPSQYNTVAQVSAYHPTGTSPTNATSVVYFHASHDNMVGVAIGINVEEATGGFDASSRNVINALIVEGGVGARFSGGSHNRIGSITMTGGVGAVAVEVNGHDYGTFGVVNWVNDASAGKLLIGAGSDNNTFLGWVGAQAVEVANNGSGTRLLTIDAL